MISRICLYFGVCWSTYGFPNTLASPIRNLYTKNNNAHGYHQYNNYPSSWDYVQSGEYMTIPDMLNNKKATLWAFLIGMLTVIFIMGSLWLLFKFGWFSEKRAECGCGCANTKITRLNSDKRRLRRSELKCKAIRHKKSLRKCKAIRCNC